MAVIIDASQFEAGLDELFGEGKMLALQEAFTEMVFSDCRENVPVDTGNLRDTAEQHTHGVGDGEVVWPAPYAIYVHSGTSKLHSVKNGMMHWVEGTAAQRGGEWADKLTGMIV